MIRSSSSLLSRKEMSRSTLRERLRIDTSPSAQNSTSLQGNQLLSPHLQSQQFLQTPSQRQSNREGLKSPVIGSFARIESRELGAIQKNTENSEMRQSRVQGYDNSEENTTNLTTESFRVRKGRKATPGKSQTVAPRKNLDNESLDHKLERMRTVGNVLLSSPKTVGTLGSEPGSTQKPIRTKYSYPQQTLVYIPQDINVLSTSNGRSAGFTSFDELAKTTKNIHADMIQSVLTQDIDLRIGYHKTPQPNTSQLAVIKQILKLNEMQQSHYNEHFYNQEQKIMATTMQDFQKNSPKFRRSPLIRVSPSRKLITNLHEFVDHHNDRNTPTQGLSDKRDSYDKNNETYGSYNSLDTTSDAHTKTRNTFGSLKFFWHFCNEERGQWRPAPRESATLTAAGNYFVLYGGISDKLIDTTTIYDPVRDVWFTPDLKGDVPLTGRHSHTACEYQGKVVIFGGGYGYSALTHVRECRNDIYMFEIDKYEWHIIKPQGVPIGARRNHAAAICEKGMYVYAGINTDGEYLSDVWVFSFKSNRWIHLDVKKERQPGQAFHTMCSCFSDRTQFIQNYKKARNFEEGLYVFGGKDGEGAVLDTLKMLSLSSETLEWKYPTTKGPTPPARFDHVMLFYEPLKILLIHGGRNNSSFTSQNSISLEDIRILHLDTMTWDMSSAIGNIPKIGRSRHAAALLGNTIAIFGGVGYNQYASPEIKLIEANQLNVWKLTKDYEAKAKRNGNVINKMMPEIFTQNQGELAANQRPKSPETDISEHLETTQLGPKRIDTTKLGSLVKNQQSESTNKNIVASVKNLVSSNGFGKTLKALNKIEGERMKLKKLGFV